MNEPSRRTWSYSTAAASASIENGLSVVRITGLVTPQVAGLILADNALWLRDTGAPGQVAIYEHALTAITADELLGSALKTIGVSPELDGPTALVVNREQTELFSAYSTLMSQRGICRAPFLSLAHATTWAARKAAAFAPLPRFPSPGGSHPAATRTGAASPP